MNCGNIVSARKYDLFQLLNSLFTFHEIIRNNHPSMIKTIPHYPLAFAKIHSKLVFHEMNGDWNPTKNKPTKFMNIGLPSNNKESKVYLLHDLSLLTLWIYFDTNTIWLLLVVEKIRRDLRIECCAKSNRLFIFQANW